jgi:hypothetical protein
MMSSQSRFHPLLQILLAALFVAVIVGISILVLSTAPKNSTASAISPIGPAPTPSLQPSPPAGWLTYTDKDAGFSFSYPPDAYFETGTTEQHPFNFIRLVFSDAGQSSLIVDVRDNTAKSTPRELAAQAYQETGGQAAPKAMLDAEETVKVGSLDAWKYIVPPTLTDFMLFIPIGDKMLVIYPGSTADPISGKTSGMDLFNQVISTFRFPTK